MIENEICITAEALTDHGFVPTTMQPTDSRSESSTQSESSTTTNANKLGVLQLKVWINKKLGIILIPNGDGYLPKFWPPLWVTPIDGNQPPFCKDSKFILTLDDLKALIEHVKNKRGHAKKTNDNNSDS